jgi:acetolactate synthase-1/2/3 large subunit
MPIVKHTFMIQHPLEILRTVGVAFHVARPGRPGPVVVDIPSDLRRADIPCEPVQDVHLPGYQPTTTGNQKQIRLAAKSLANARRRVIYAGGGGVSANASAQLVELVSVDRLPVTCTLMGLGAFPAAHEQWLGMLGMRRHPDRELRDGRGGPDYRGRRPLRRSHHRQDLGVRATGEVLHIDVDPARDLQERSAHIPIVGRAANILPRLTAEYRALDTDPARLEEWWSRIRVWRERHPLRYEDSTDAEIKPEYMVQAL